MIQFDVFLHKYPLLQLTLIFHDRYNILFLFSYTVLKTKYYNTRDVNDIIISFSDSS